MSRFLTAKPPQLGTFSQYSGLDTSSSSLLSHASSLFDKITPASSASVEASPSSTPLLSPFEEKSQSDLVTMEVDLSADVPISPFDPDFEMPADGGGDGEVYSSVMPLIDYAPDHSVDIDAITPESMEMVVRLQALGCELDAGTILNNIASAKAEIRADARAASTGYDVGSVRSELPRDVDWLAFIETVLPNLNARKAYMDSFKSITPPPAPRLHPTQLPDDDDIPELPSLFEGFPAMEAQISEFAASLKAAAAVRASVPLRGAQAVATPASMLFGTLPEPVSMQVPRSAFGVPGGSPRGFSTPKQSEKTPAPPTRGCVGNDGVTSGDDIGFRLDISTPELRQVMHDGFAASESLLDMALQLETGSEPFSSSPLRDSLKMVDDLGPRNTPPFSAWAISPQRSPAWDTPSRLPLGPIFPIQSANAMNRTPPGGIVPVSYSHSSSVTITTTDIQAQIVRSCSTVSLLQHSASQTSMHCLPSAAQVPLQNMSLSQPHLASHSSPKGTLRLGKAPHMNATAVFDGIVEEICELLVSEKMSGNVQLYLETLTYQLESMLRESQAVLMHEVRKSRVGERSSGRISRRGALRKVSRRAGRDSPVVYPQSPPLLRPSALVDAPPRTSSLSSCGSSSPFVFRRSPRSPSPSSASPDREAAGQGSPISTSPSPRKELASFLPSNSAGSHERLSPSGSNTPADRSGSPCKTWDGRRKSIMRSVISGKAGAGHRMKEAPGA